MNRFLRLLSRFEKPKNMGHFWATHNLFVKRAHTQSEKSPGNIYRKNDN